MIKCITKPKYNDIDEFVNWLNQSNSMVKIFFFINILETCKTKNNILKKIRRREGKENKNKEREINL